MKRVLPERRANILARLLLPSNMTVVAAAQMVGISEATHYNWSNQAKLDGVTLNPAPEK